MAPTLTKNRKALLQRLENVFKQRPHQVFSLVLVTKNDEKGKIKEILLGQKSSPTTHPAYGKWNGYGGKLEKGETPIESAYREFKEECGATVKNLKQVGLLHFAFDENVEKRIYDIHVFCSTEVEGDIQETKEMIKPKWFKVKDIPYKDMWADDLLWYPYLLKGKRIHGHFECTGYQDIEEYDIVELTTTQSFDKL